MMNQAEILINLCFIQTYMRKLFAILRAVINGEVSIDSVDKSPITRAPGDVTELSHN
jgi:hypothetical protein